ncbi:unnamed protein product [Ilex paraguariensis]|uniref:Uncharacterized protein n=1 Tax=Ilex paraguariensis TaxID=185542 RepID=A0ABC8RYJ1_9AQUA
MEFSLGRFLEVWSVWQAISGMFEDINNDSKTLFSKDYFNRVLQTIVDRQYLQRPLIEKTIDLHVIDLQMGMCQGQFVLLTQKKKRAIRPSHMVFSRPNCF